LTTLSGSLSRLNSSYLTIGDCRWSLSRILVIGTLPQDIDRLARDALTCCSKKTAQDAKGRALCVRVDQSNCSEPFQKLRANGLVHPVPLAGLASKVVAIEHRVHRALAGMRTSPAAV
jgi:hypothetical protein